MEKWLSIIYFRCFIASCIIFDSWFTKRLQILKCDQGVHFYKRSEVFLCLTDDFRRLCDAQRILHNIFWPPLAHLLWLFYYFRCTKHKIIISITPTASSLQRHPTSCTSCVLMSDFLGCFVVWVQREEKKRSCCWCDH